jgi:hypothetical protein
MKLRESSDSLITNPDFVLYFKYVSPPRLDLSEDIPNYLEEAVGIVSIFRVISRSCWKRMIVIASVMWIFVSIPSTFFPFVFPFFHIMNVNFHGA